MEEKQGGREGADAESAGRAKAFYITILTLRRFVIRL